MLPHPITNPSGVVTDQPASTARTVNVRTAFRLTIAFIVAAIVVTSCGSARAASPADSLTAIACTLYAEVTAGRMPNEKYVHFEGLRRDARRMLVKAKNKDDEAAAVAAVVVVERAVASWMEGAR